MKFRNRLIALAGLALMAGCANRGGGPQGGPKDLTPPKAASMNPENNATNVSKKKIELQFNEFVEVKSAQQKVIVSPPQKIPATIQANGKKVTIEFADSLIPNTTYTIDFTDALRDLNEGNVLDGFTYAFSTGNEIDTMQISGRVLNAMDLNPLSGVQVGIYETNLKGDSTGPLYQMPLRITKTDSTGHFTIKNIKDGTYDIYALEDKNSDYILTKGECFGFIDNSVKTAVESIERRDTVRIDLAKADANSKKKKKKLAEIPDSLRYKDTIVHSIVQHYTPDDVLLLASAMPTTPQKVKKTERKNPFRIDLYMQNENARKRPEVRCLNNIDILQRYSKKNDSITIWIKDSVMAAADTIKLEVKYETLDSLDKPTDKTDTIKAVFSKKMLQKLKKEKQTLGFAKIEDNVPFYAPLRVAFDRPVSEIDTSKIKLYSAEDTTWTQVPLTQYAVTEIDSTSSTNSGYFAGYEYKVEWNEELKYTIKVDSGAAFGLGGVTNKALKKEFKIIGSDKYANLKVITKNSGKNPVIQLLNDKDEVIREKSEDANGTLFEHLAQGDYYLRLYNDENNDGEWTPGDFKEKRHAEKVFYLNTKVHLRANWDIDQEWDVEAIQLEKQKPETLKKEAAKNNNNSKKKKK